MEHEHIVRDSDARFSIDPVTRMIKNESKKKLSLIQGDHNSEIFSFTCPRFIESHDMAQCNKVEVHFFNYDAQTNKFNSGIYEANDLQVGEDENTVVFSWTISGNGTQLQGRLEFLIRFKCEEEGTVTYAWNTAFFTETNIGKGSNADALFETEYVDIIEQWKASVLQKFEDEFNEWKKKIETQVVININEWKQEAKEGLTEWKKTESDEVHQVMGDYETYMNRQHAELKARMDTFTSLKEGSTTGDAELQDIRVDVDGVIHDNAGTAIRKRDNLLKKFNEGSIATTFFCDVDLFEIGSWNHGDVKSEGEIYRVRSADAIYFPYDVLISIADGFQVRGYWCGGNGVSVDLFTWKTTPFAVPANQKFKIVIARINENTSEIANITDFVGKLTIKSGMRVEFDTLKNNVDRLRVYSFGFRTEDFVHGWIEGWNNGILNTTPKYRIVTPYVMRFPFDMTIYAKEGFRFALNYWENGQFVSDELWQTKYTVPADQDFKIMIGRATEDSTETVEIEELAKQIYVVSSVDRHMKESSNQFMQLKDVVESVKVFNKEINSINHRGYNSIAPENTLPAFKLSKKNGFDFVETDIRFTADNIPVLMHDETINRTGRNADGSAIENTVNISDITYSEALTFDFGVHKSVNYAGVKIPTFDEFIVLCRNIGLHPYIEIEGEITSKQAELLINIVDNCGLTNHVTWLSFSYESLLRIAEVHPNARVGLNCITNDGLTVNQINYIEKLKAINSNVFIHADTNSIDACVEDAKTHGLALELWCPNTEEEIINLPHYVTGVTTDKLIAKDVLYNAFIV